MLATKGNQVSTTTTFMSQYFPEQCSFTILKFSFLPSILYLQYSRYFFRHFPFYKFTMLVHDTFRGRKLLIDLCWRPAYLHFVLLSVRYRVILVFYSVVKILRPQERTWQFHVRNYFLIKILFDEYKIFDCLLYC